MTRLTCSDCAVLVANEKGEWLCDECGKKVEDVERCPEGMHDEE